MARQASVALAGYFPTPQHLVPLIAEYFSGEAWDSITVVDPCAGEGTAVLDLCARIPLKTNLWSCELEKGRYEVLQGAVKKSLGYGPSNESLQGDAFQVEFLPRTSALLYLNPPYDTNPVYGRLEERFLSRFSPILSHEGGALVFLVPYYALKASAQTLAREFDDLLCMRFPGADFDSFKQVCLIGRKVPTRLVPDSRIVTQVESWSADVSGLPELGVPDKVYPLSHGYVYGARWRMRKIDLVGLSRKARPWQQTSRFGETTQTPHILPETPVQDLMFRTFPVATAPRPAHTASGIASGMFNGRRVMARESGLPDLLVKGSFDREFVTIEEKQDKSGMVTSIVQVQQPKLVTTVLDLSTRKYHTLALGKSGSRKVSEFGIEDLLQHYGKSLLHIMQEQCPVTYDPRRDGGSQVLAPVNRKLFRAQEHASKAILSLLGGPDCKDRRYKAAILLGEIGSGKCLGLGTLVLKYDGTVIPVEEVKVGYDLMGPDSLPRRVTGTTRGSGPLFRVVPTVGDPWVCNDAHILTLVHTMSDDIFDIPVTQYANSKRLALRLSKQYQWPRRRGQKCEGRNTHPVTEFKQFFPEDGVEFPPVDPVLVDPYFYGLWYGDGSKTFSKGRLTTVQITTIDQEIVGFLEGMAVQYGLRLRENEKTSSKCSSYSFSVGLRQNPRKPNPILNELRKVYGNGEHLPNQLLLGTKETRRAFLAGLLDSDGHLSHGVFDIIQKRRKWSEDICFLARSLGIRATLWSEYKSAHRGEKGDLYWRVCLSGDFTKLPIRLPRKQASPRASIRKNRASLDFNYGTRRAKNVNRTGIRIEPVGIGNYAGFELDGDGRFLLGDFTVTHNTACALTVGRTIGSRMLILCPPHLLQSWTDETKLALPEAEIRILQDVSDVESLLKVPEDKFLVAILSRETAKLSHGMESVTRACPKCGASVPGGDLAKRRECCHHKPLCVQDPLAQAAYDLALKLAPYDPKDSQIGAILESRYLQQCLKLFEKRPASKWQPLSADWLDPLIDLVITGALERTEGFEKLLGALLLSNYRPNKILEIAKKVGEDLSWGRFEIVRALGSLLPSGSEGREEVLSITRQSNTYSYGWGGVSSMGEGEVLTSFGYVKWVEGLPVLEKCPANSYRVADLVFKSLCSLGKFSRGEECGEPLYQAVPKPRRVALAKYITRKHKNLFDFIVLDECHEYQSDCSAQGISAHRLTELGIPTLLMTGSIMNGYAESLFTNMWAISRDFRREFDRDEKQLFIDRYGYRKRVLSEKDRKTGEIVEFGSQTDRVERLERKSGDAPGILPLFLFRHLLQFSVTLHKADLALDLPLCRQIKCEVDADPSLLDSFKSLQQALLVQIRKDMYDKDGLSGKLFGALAELPSYLDRATEDTGNQEDGSYVIKYPESVGGAEVARGKSLPASQILAKEAWMLDTVESELAEGRNVMVYCWHVSLLPRLAKLIEQRTGKKTPILFANKVSTAKRQAWIDDKIVKKGCRVLVTNPVCVQTGLNNLVHFATEIWHENPACNPTIFRQAIGRIDRIGQKLETRVYFPVYRGTLQETLHELLLRKVAVATMTDGLDPESALISAGATTEGYLTGLSIGRQLWNILQETA